MTGTRRGRVRGFLAAGVAMAVMLALVAPAAAAISFNTVIIDAGHGGHDSGAARNNLVEKKLCLDLAKRLESALTKRGLRVVMTRRTDSFVSLSGRCNLANRYSRAIFVSVHFNSTSNRLISGMEVYYRGAKGRELAASVLSSMYKRVKGKSRGIKYAGYKVLRSTVMPAIVVEGGYISNRVEAARCGTAAHRQGLADAIAIGITSVRSRR